MCHLKCYYLTPSPSRVTSYEYSNNIACTVNRDRRGRDRMVVGVITTYVISAFHQ